MVDDLDDGGQALGIGAGGEEDDPANLHLLPLRSSHVNLRHLGWSESRNVSRRCLDLNVPLTDLL